MSMDSHRERARVKDRDEEQRTAEKLRRELRGEVSADRVLRRSTSSYLQELESDPKRIGFAYGGIYPGRLHARGRHIEKHEVHFSVGVSGHYLLHVSLRSNALHPIIPLPGSPFELHVKPGVAHPLSTQIPPSELPLRGSLEKLSDVELRMSRPGEKPRQPRCKCELLLHACDKMGNICDSGGADITCGGLDESTELEMDTKDVGNGTYVLSWMSATPGSFTVFVKIDGLHVLGSPALLQLTSGTPDMGKTVVDWLPHHRKGSAGKTTKLQLRCKDAAGHPAVPGAQCTFGVTLVPTTIPDVEAWRRYEAEQIERTVLGDQLELSFTPKLAHELKVFMWAAIDEPKSQKSAGDRRGGATYGPVDALVPSTNPNGDNSPNGQRRKHMQRRDSISADCRRLLPGSPYLMQVTPAELSVKHSYIDGIQQHVNGVWEDVLNCMIAGKPKKPPVTTALVPLDPDKSPNDGDTSGPEDDVPAFSMEEEASTLVVGDSLRLRPLLCDEFNNPVGVKNQSVELVVTGPAGEERIPIISAIIRGVYVYDVQYELRARGKYKLDVLVDEVAISGCPIEWAVKVHRAPDVQRRSGQKE